MSSWSRRGAPGAEPKRTAISWHAKWHLVHGWRLRCAAEAGTGSLVGLDRLHPRFEEGWKVHVTRHQQCPRPQIPPPPAQTWSAAVRDIFLNTGAFTIHEGGAEARARAAVQGVAGQVRYDSRLFPYRYVRC